jgi:tetratricopeptide (TPR) repeat protein
MPDLRRMDAGEFARRLRLDSPMPDKRYAFFIGAGCSISSGIPGAASLVRDFWLPKLQEICAPDSGEFGHWLNRELPDYVSSNPAASYGCVIERLFLNPEDRQREIERLCEGKFPGFGYAVLATLIAEYAGSFNVVITTNFDDLVSDALFLFTSARPLVIGHESLAGFIRPTRTRPIVIKIHGDARLAPQNTIAETSSLQKEVEGQVRALLHDRGLIFMGYGGNDNGIKEMLLGLPKEALPYGVYWIGGSEPQGTLRSWLEDRKAIWVERSDFDEMMLLIRDSFDLPHPDKNPFEVVFQKYGETYQTLSDKIHFEPNGTENVSLKQAVLRADSDLKGWLAQYVEANRLERTDPEKADRVYQEGIAAYPTASMLLSGYASFLRRTTQDYDRVEGLYERAVEADPTNSQVIQEYASFLENVRGHWEAAAQLYNRCIELVPTNFEVRHRLGYVYRFYGRTTEAIKLFESLLDTPLAAHGLNGLANVYRDCGNLPKAIEYYTRALEVTPPAERDDQVYNDNLANVYMELGKYTEANKRYLAMIEQDSMSIAYASLATCCLKVGAGEEAEKHALVARALLPTYPIFVQARVEAVDKNVDETLACLDKVLKAHTIPKAWINRDPNFDIIRDDPKFQQFMSA